MNPKPTLCPDAFLATFKPSPAPITRTAKIRAARQRFAALYTLIADGTLSQQAARRALQIGNVTIHRWMRRAAAVQAVITRTTDPAAIAAAAIDRASVSSAAVPALDRLIGDKVGRRLEAKRRQSLRIPSAPSQGAA